MHDLKLEILVINLFYNSIFCSYWMGSQQMQQPMYQYRIILPYDDKIVNVATDMDFNIEGEAKGPIAKNTTAKSTFVVSYH